MPTPILFEKRIQAAAFHYAVMEVRDANALAELVGVSARSLYRVATDASHRLHDFWRTELSAMGYDEPVTGFRVKARGRQMDMELFEQVRAVWLAMGEERRRGSSRRELGLEIVEEFEITLPTALSWLRKYERELSG